MSSQEGGRDTDSPTAPGKAGGPFKAKSDESNLELPHPTPPQALQFTPAGRESLRTFVFDGLDTEKSGGTYPVVNNPFRFAREPRGPPHLHLRDDQLEYLRIEREKLAAPRVSKDKHDEVFEEDAEEEVDKVSEQDQAHKELKAKYDELSKHTAELNSNCDFLSRGNDVIQTKLNHCGQALGKACDDLDAKTKEAEKLAQTIKKLQQQPQTSTKAQASIKPGPVSDANAAVKPEEHRDTVRKLEEVTAANGALTSTNEKLEADLKAKQWLNGELKRFAKTDKASIAVKEKDIEDLRRALSSLEATLNTQRTKHVDDSQSAEKRHAEETRRLTTSTQNSESHIATLKKDLGQTRQELVAMSQKCEQRKVDHNNFARKHERCADAEVLKDQLLDTIANLNQQIWSHTYGEAKQRLKEEYQQELRDQAVEYQKKIDELTASTKRPRSLSNELAGEEEPPKRIPLSIAIPAAGMQETIPVSPSAPPVQPKPQKQRGQFSLSSIKSVNTAPVAPAPTVPTPPRMFEPAPAAGRTKYQSPLGLGLFVATCYIFSVVHGIYHHVPDAMDYHKRAGIGPNGLPIGWSGARSVLGGW